MYFLFLNRNRTLDTFHDHKNTETEKFKKEVINVFNQTASDNPSETETSTNHTFLAPQDYSSSAEHFAHKPPTQDSSLKSDVDDEFSLKNDTLQVNYAPSDYLSSHSETISRKRGKMHLH